MTSQATASAPASSANLGPAFDSMALALELRCVVKAEPSDTWAVDHIGSHRPAGSESDAVLIAARMAVGDENPLRLTVDNAIPIGKGLGSSSAAFVSGVAAALRATDGEPNPDHVFRVAADLEGHDDNVAAAVYGGLILVPAEGMPVRLPIHPSLHPVVAVPPSRLSTKTARSAVAASFSRDVTVRSLARVAALTAGLITADPELLSSAHGDEIHESVRADLSPEVERMIRIARSAGAFHAARSGAGPSVLALVGQDGLADLVSALEEEGFDALQPGVAT
ncbi:MAG: homoserine kinase, partial [Acidimicrobiia bacterium]